MRMACYTAKLLQSRTLLNDLVHNQSDRECFVSVYFYVCLVFKIHFRAPCKVMLVTMMTMVFRRLYRCRSVWLCIASVVSLLLTRCAPDRREIAVYSISFRLYVVSKVKARCNDVVSLAISQIPLRYLVRSQLRTSSEHVRSQLRTRQRNGIWLYICRSNQ